jgi:AraC family transcriptional regulator
VGSAGFPGAGLIGCQQEESYLREQSFIMLPAVTQKEHHLRIARVIDYIFKHSTENLSIEILAAVAHYSPDHLQKVFKQAVGESPKQYSLKLRLETALLLLILHPGRSVAAIGLDCGFSSPAVFSRAVKNYFGHPPEQLRKMSHRQRMTILHDAQPDHVTIPGSSGHSEPFVKPEIQIVRREPTSGIYQLAAFNEPAAIRRAFQSLHCFAQTNGIESPSLYGILSPLRRNSYRACLRITTDDDRPFPVCEIPGGTFASFSVSGDLKQARNALHYFGHRWLPVNGYKVAGFEGMETFTESPWSKSYLQLQRQLYIPIEPV